MDIVIIVAILVVVGFITYLYLDRQAQMRRQRAEEVRRQDNEARRRAEEDRQREDELRRRAEETRRYQEQQQQRLYNALTVTVADSNEIVSKLPSVLSRAGGSLSTAEREFSAGAFAPFWDAVEDAAYWLAKYKDYIDKLNRNAETYTRDVSQFSGMPPTFQFSVKDLPEARRTVERMSAIVRKGQTNINFATIYEQRKTNKLLMAGFSTLNDTLKGLEYRLNASLYNLSVSLSNTTKR
ncbi:MAG TPA: hypothetical protein PKD09_17595 [Aggregatilinea sp.]|uniref:hypothetical protein n=1 Tax=Aggregatilinea sp. TaxID=2806333 RepID=UPI002C68AD47|nr:hypothetical protein [Aggregatilinea sp.]HML23474.1 hypothetical protein [Aggregatilinea sp.]